VLYGLLFRILGFASSQFGSECGKVVPCWRFIVEDFGFLVQGLGVGIASVALGFRA